jgi:hypothetical protein
VYFTTALPKFRKRGAFISTDGKMDEVRKNSLPVCPFEKAAAYSISDEASIAGK